VGDARSVSGLIRRGGIFVNANAISPATAKVIAEITGEVAAALVGGQAVDRSR
jgi:hypothetical protein